jgi:hypothetical protein
MIRERVEKIEAAYKEASILCRELAVGNFPIFVEEDVCPIIDEADIWETSRVSLEIISKLEVLRNLKFIQQAFEGMLVVKKNMLAAKYSRLKEGCEVTCDDYVYYCDCCGTGLDQSQEYIMIDVGENSYILCADQEGCADEYRSELEEIFQALREEFEMFIQVLRPEIAVEISV